MQQAYTGATAPSLASFAALIDELLTMQRAFTDALAREDAVARTALAPRIAAIEATLARCPAYSAKVHAIHEQMLRIGRRTRALGARRADMLAQLDDAQRQAYAVLLSKPT